MPAMLVHKGVGENKKGEGKGMKLKRPLVYIAGRYRARTKLGVILNIWRAYRAARKLTKEGYACIVPHLETALMDGLQSDEFFLEAGLKKLRHCDLVFAMKGYEKSKGSMLELEEAIKKRIPIRYEVII